MKHHETLQELFNAINKLTFSFKTKMEQHSKDDPTGIDVTYNLLCNNQSLEEFTLSLNSIRTSIENQISTTLMKKGADYKKEIIEILISTDEYLRYYGYQESFKGIIIDEQKKDLEDNQAYKLGAIEYRNITQSKVVKSEFFLCIKNEIKKLKDFLSTQVIDVDSKNTVQQKLKFNTPRASILASLINELEAKRWIELPKRQGEVNYAALARLCDAIFEFEGTKKSLHNHFKDKNIVSEVYKNKINLGDIDDFK
ncbi:MAG: hypothetical protein MK212_19260 [Saprospiraceae bacterium]|nr:hypothetical protein [Saprospiraceae bacterium]